MNRILANFILLRSIEIDPTTQTDHVPYKLISLLGKCGFRLSEDLEGKITKDYETEVIEKLHQHILDVFGVGDIWNSVYTSPDSMPDEEIQKLHQSILYCNPERLGEIKSQYNTSKDTTWLKNEYPIREVLLPTLPGKLEEKISEFLSSPRPLWGNDYSYLDWAISEGLNLAYPREIPCKELLARVLSLGVGMESMSSVNDVLRVAIYMSSNIVNLDVNTRIKLSGKQRKLVIRLLEEYVASHKFEATIQDTYKYYNKLVILSQVLHPRSFIAVKFFHDLCFGDKKIIKDRFTSRLQRSYDTGDISETIRILSTRPGELLRRFDSLLRRIYNNHYSEDWDKLQEIMLSKAKEFNPALLIQLHRHFDTRDKELPRSYLDKNGTRHEYGTLSALDKDLITLGQSMIYQILGERYSGDSLSGRTFRLDIPDGVDINLSNRGATGDSTGYPGQKVYFKKEGILRFFTQWIDPDGTEDLDIHGFLFDENLGMTTINFNTSFMSGDKTIAHSGDVRFVKGNCSEFISVDFRKDIKYKWLIVGVQNYESPSLRDLENYVGFGTIKNDTQETLFRAKVTLGEKNMIGYAVNLEEGYIRLILEGTNQDIIHIKKDSLLGYLGEHSLDLKKLLELYVIKNGGKIVEESPDEIITMNSSILENLICVEKRS